MTGSRHRNAKQRTVDRVYEDVRADIIRGQHPPGSRLTEDRTDLLVWRQAFFEPPLQALMRFLHTPEFHDRAAEMSGYDVGAAGTVHYNAPGP